MADIKIDPAVALEEARADVEHYRNRCVVLRQLLKDAQDALIATRAVAEAKEEPTQ